MPPPPPPLGGIPPPPGMGVPLPPGVGGPPPPPGMGMPRALVPRKPVVKPVKKLKKVHWNRVILPLQGPETVWSSIKEVNFDADEFEDEFAEKTVATKMKAAVGGAAEDDDSKKSKKQAVRILDAKRSNAIAILMSSLPKLSQIKQAIVSMDSSSLDETKLSALREQWLAVTEEVRRADLEELSKMSPEELDRPEQLLQILLTIPNLPARLQCWAFSLSFNDRREEMVKQLDSIFDGCSALQKSEQVKELLAVVLTLGNYLNGGTPKGQADGFDLEFLLRLSATKGSSSTSLLQYACNLAARSVSDLKEIKGQMRAVYDASSKSPLDDTMKDVERFNDLFNTMKKTMETVSKAPCGTDDKFERTMRAFYKDAEAHMQALSDLAKMTGMAYKKTHSFFGTSQPNETLRPSNEFFNIFSTFFNEVEVAAPANTGDKPTKQSAPVKRKHKVGEKITDGDGGKGDNAPAPMQSIIDAIKGGKTVLKKGPSGGFDPSKRSPLSPAGPTLPAFTLRPVGSR